MDGAINPNTQTPFLIATIAVIVVVLFEWLYPKRKPSPPHSEKSIPPGSFGLPIFGELLGWIRALEGGAGYKWIEERVGRYGPVFKTSFMGTKMVFVTGQVSNKFVFTSPDDMLQSHQPVPIVHMTGEQSIFEVHGGRHKLVQWVTLTHMDETAFPEPEKFDPSRFEGATKSFPPYMYVPFGGGQRVCPGNDYARVSLSLIVHHLVTNFRWSMLIPNEPIVRIPFADPAMNLPIKIYRRGEEA
ncbi:hypothetical protein QJS10_CPB11g01679 [Acorus calamus]|uniref:Cytochrome P450 n=1 Tax=Acorus calamus TaxID=4465 RepID=A0AAV9DWF6_ACOCL|nr:hypothetical protein QJS10_CPB11g01679 [Acorus calamus]